MNEKTSESKEYLILYLAYSFLEKLKKQGLITEKQLKQIHAKNVEYVSFHK